MKALRNLNSIRTDIEHAANPHAEEAVRDAIASAFPVIAQLFDAMEEQPAGELGDETWGAMLSVREMYEREKRQCDATFAHIDWGTGGILGGMERTCPDCGSPLVEASIAEGQNFQWATVRCRRCGNSPSIEQFVVHLVGEHYAVDSYRAGMGEVSAPVHDCPDCSVHAYLTTEDHNGCVWCEFELGACAVCSEPLTPDNVDGDNNELCSYHGYVMSKEDLSSSGCVL